MKISIAISTFEAGGQGANMINFSLKKIMEQTWAFKEVVISEIVGYKKPHVNVFRYAENAAGSTPVNSIMIGDPYEADIIGALNSGWKAIYFEPNASDVEDADGLIHIRSLHEIMNIL